MRLDSKIKIICNPEDETLDEMIAYAKKLIFENVEVFVNWMGVEIPIKKRSTVMGCVNYTLARSPEFARKHVTCTTLI